MSWKSQISLSQECDFGDEQTKFSLETVTRTLILIHTASNSVKNQDFGSKNREIRIWSDFTEILTKGP